VTPRVDTVVKVGGALLAAPGPLDSVVRALESAVARGDGIASSPAADRSPTRSGASTTR